MPALDVVVARRLYAVGFPVYLRAIKHLSLIANSRIVEPGISSLFAAIQESAQIKVFWDVGANIGLHTWRLITKDPQLKAILFEPDPDNAALLKSTIRAADLKQVQVMEVAVSDTAGSATFALDPSSGATGSLIVDQTFNQRLFGQAPRCITVPTVRLDDLLQTQDPPDLIKIDVELAEHLVFRGATTLLAGQKPFIIFECGSENRSEIVERLQSLGYQVLGADHPAQPISGALNLLAIPPLYQEPAEQLLDRWKNQYDSYVR